MGARTMPVPLDQGRAACADHLDLVDAAAERPGGPEAREMKRTLCRTCPAVEACFVWAYSHAEFGVWAGTTPKQRTGHGAPSASKQVTAMHRRRAKVDGRPEVPHA